MPDLTGNGAGLSGGASPAVAVATEQVTFTVNALGQTKTLTDRNGDVRLQRPGPNAASRRRTPPFTPLPMSV